MKFSGVKILQGVEISIFLLIFEWPYNSAALLRCLWLFVVALLYIVINVGTSSQFTFLMPEGFIPSADSIDKSSPVEYVPFFDGRYLSETASLNGGNVLDAFINMLRDWLGEFGM